MPAVSLVQWHPFTVSSAPSDETRTFHIKDMGAGTWTHDLATLVTRDADGGDGMLSFKNAFVACLCDSAFCRCCERVRVT